MELQFLLDKSASQHKHLCPRQILGVRLGLLGLQMLGFKEPPPKKRLMVIAESDGCFADGIIAATDCTVGHRTLRIEDYGKTAATFVDVTGGQAVRVTPTLDIRERAYLHAPDEPKHYFAQMQAYKIMPDDEMFTVEKVVLKKTIKEIVSRAGIRTNCDICGEEINNEREIYQGGLRLCHICAGGGYYKVAMPVLSELHKDFQLASLPI